MYIELEEELIKKIEKITIERMRKIGNLVEVEDLIENIKDLLIAYDKIEEKLEDEVEQRESYWKPKTEYEIIGMKESDF